MAEESTTIAKKLEEDVRKLTAYGERNTGKPKGLNGAADWLKKEFAKMGYEVTPQEYTVDGVRCENVEATAKGFDAKRPHLLIGAHYDSAPGTPGADDNASAVAIMLELARRFANEKGIERVRFVAFTNEEPPYFQTAAMGSQVFAKRCTTRGERIAVMICLESLGVYHDEAGSQEVPVDPTRLKLPPGLDPTVGNFVGIVGDAPSMRWANGMAKEFGLEVPGLPVEMREMTLSDHVSFWEAGYEAIMLTDTAPFRNAHYHKASDTAEKLDYARMAIVTDAIERALRKWIEEAQ